MLVQNDDFVRLLHGLRDGLTVERRDGAQVEDFNVDSVVLQNVSSLQSGVDHGGVGNNAEIAAFAGDARFANGNNIVFGGDFSLDAAVKILVLEKDAGIVVADGGLNQAFRIVRRGGADDFEARVMDEPHFGILRMKRAAVDVSAAGAAQNQRRGRTPEIMSFRDHVGNLVESAADEIHELKFGDRAHAGERCAESRAHNGRFSDRCIDHAISSETVDEAVRDFESSAVNADVLADAED